MIHGDTVESERWEVFLGKPAEGKVYECQRSYLSKLLMSIQICRMVDHFFMPILPTFLTRLQFSNPLNPDNQAACFVTSRF